MIYYYKVSLVSILKSLPKTLTKSLRTWNPAAALGTANWNEVQKLVKTLIYK